MSAPQTGWNRIQRSAQRQKPAAIGQLVRAYTLQTGRRAILDRCDQAARSRAYAKDGVRSWRRRSRRTSQSIRAHMLQTGKKYLQKQSPPKPKPDAIEDDPQARSTKRTKKQSDRSTKSKRICSLLRPPQRKERQQQSNNFFPKTWDEKSSEVKYRPHKSPRSVRTTRKFQTDIKSKK